MNVELMALPSSLIFLQYSLSNNSHLSKSITTSSEMRRIRLEVAPHYDELFVLRCKATNEESYPFRWVSEFGVKMD